MAGRNLAGLHLPHMSRRGKTVALGMAAFPAAILLFTLATLPPRQAHVDTSDWQSNASPVVRGAFHVHSSRSDGSGSVEEIAAAAARAGLGFVILTDHGDGTRPPEAPTYREGVLSLDAVEISTTGGHLVAVDLRQAPYPLGGKPGDVAEDVARLGGLGIVAHPESQKPELRWRDWSIVFGGMEWLNADSQWRDDPLPRLVRALFQYPFRSPETMASLLDRPVESLTRWDALTPGRRIVALAGSDAHARLDPWSGDDHGDRTGVFNFPSYEQSFRAFTIRVELDTPLAGRAARDAEALVRAIRAGRVYTVIDALAAPTAFEFGARSGNVIARMGEELTIGGPVELEARAAGPPGAQIVLIRDGKVVAVEDGPALRHTAAAEPAVFRVEVRLPRAPGDPPVPWIVSNPIYVGGVSGEPRPSRERRPPTTVQVLFADADTEPWTVERDPASRASVDRVRTDEGPELRLDYTLWGGPRGTQYVALVYSDIGNAAAYERLVFRARADRPMRVSVQFRLSGGPADRRWQRSVYLDENSQELMVFFDEMTPVGDATTEQPPLDPVQVQALLFVIDTVNTAPATEGVLWLQDVRLEAD